MDPHPLTQPSELEKNSFLWSEARLVIAAIALFIGGVPPILAINPIPALYGMLQLGLTLAWIISGAASAYLVWRWNANGKKIFGGANGRDTAAFLVSIVSGLNLGLTGLLGTNIGMSISSNRVVFAVVAVLYLAAAYHLWQRWTLYGKKLF